MASQEEYLDQLLKEMMGTDPGQAHTKATKEEPIETKDTPAEEPPVEEAPIEEPTVEEIPIEEEPAPESPRFELPEEFTTFDDEDDEDAPGEEDIERMLAETRAAAEEPDPDEIDFGGQDLMDLLSGTGDREMDEVHDLLRKNEENEAVDSSIFEEAEDHDAEIAAALEEPAEQLSPQEQKKLAREKARADRAAARAEKAAARAEAKARKKEAAEARKAAKAAKKAQKAGKSETESDELDQMQPIGEAQPEPAIENEFPNAPEKDFTETSQPAAQSEPMEVDMSDMDALLGLDSLIPNVGQPESEASAEKSAPEEIPDAGEIAADAGEPSEEGIPGAESETEESGKKPKKGFLAKILNLLTEESLDEEEEAKGTEDIPLSDENQAILDELDQEGDAKGKKGGKKPKKEKKKKEKKPKEKKPKAEKPKKPKKEKAPKEKEPGPPAKKIPFKRILPLIVLGITVFAAIFLIIKVGGSAISKKQATQAFYEEDYETCYQELYGKELNESEQVMYAKSESILRVNLWMREYEIYAEEGSEVEALDVLIQAVEDYPLLETYATEWNAYSEVRAVYEQMLSILSDKYHLTEEQAQAIAAVKDDEEYTRQVTAMASGEAYDSWNEPVYETEQLPDMLPEEQNFQENQIEVSQ